MFIYWLVVWKMFYFSIHGEFSPQLTFIFFRGVETTNQQCLVTWGVQVIQYLLSIKAPLYWTPATFFF